MTAGPNNATAFPGFGAIAATATGREMVAVTGYVDPVLGALVAGNLAREQQAVLAQMQTVAHASTIVPGGGATSIIPATMLSPGGGQLVQLSGAPADMTLAGFLGIAGMAAAGATPASAAPQNAQQLLAAIQAIQAMLARLGGTTATT